MKTHTRSGYIFIITLIILASLTFMVTQIATKADAFIQYAHGAVDQQKARSLALAGIHLGMSQLADGMRSGTQEASATITESDQQLSLRLLRTIVPLNGKLQTYTLKREPDGINGRIALCITCEDAKLDLNAIYDIKKSAFVGEGQAQGDYKKVVQKLFERIEERTKNKDLFAQFLLLLKNRRMVLDDVTQLLQEKAFAIFSDAVFYEPATMLKSEQSQQPQLYLADMFTVWSNKRMLEPWLLTQSVCAILGLKRTFDEKTEIALPKDMKDTFVWEKDWDTYLAPVYGKKYAELPEFIRPLLSTKFEPHTFSVLSYGKIGRVTQKVLAIVELREMTEQKKQKKFNASIRTMYWL